MENAATATTQGTHKSLPINTLLTSFISNSSESATQHQSWHAVREREHWNNTSQHTTAISAGDTADTRTRTRTAGWHVAELLCWLALTCVVVVNKEKVKLLYKQVMNDETVKQRLYKTCCQWRRDDCWTLNINTRGTNTERRHVVFTFFFQSHLLDVECFAADPEKFQVWQSDCCCDFYMKWLECWFRHETNMLHF